MSKVWLITGNFRGLGRALAEAVLAAGHKLVATARNPAQGPIRESQKTSLPSFPSV